jgi:selenocysteine lyase/cysteine desulfurase
MLDRRELFGVAALAAPALLPRRAALALERAAALRGDRAPEEVARDEDFWREIQQAYAVDRSLVNLNNGGVSPAPRVAMDALERQLELVNELPSHHLWNVQGPAREGVRQQLAGAWGVDAEEIALTRNASEGLQICQLGFDLEPGDEVLTSDQDYPRMLTTFEQRARREGLVLKTFPLPTPCEDPAQLVRLFEERITARTRLILCCQVINLTGQILPVKDIVALGRGRGVPVIVDGAHAFAHLDFKIPDLGCDYYATSLHKWLSAPIGTGLLYVRRERIQGLWPLMAARAEQDADIRKFEEIGTHPEANMLAAAQALAFHLGIGPANKLARLLYLRDRWAKRLAAHDRVHLNTSLKPGCASGLGNARVEGVDTDKLQQHLWERHKIFTTPIKHKEAGGLRISPHVYTTLGEIDRFCEAVEDVLAHGLPE